MYDIHQTHPYIYNITQLTLIEDLDNEILCVCVRVMALPVVIKYFCIYNIIYSMDIVCPNYRIIYIFIYKCVDIGCMRYL